MSQNSRLFFLLCGLAPSLVLLLGSHFIPDLGELGWFSIGINATGSLISGVGLLSGERDLFVRIFLGSFLASLLFVLNVFVVFTVGCVCSN
jgi:hypothetical protein